MNTQKVNVYKCLVCESYYHDRFSASECCKVTTCTHCKETILKGKQLCKVCEEEIRYASAKKLVINDYKEEVIWDWQSEKYFSLDDFHKYYEENTDIKKPKYVYACKFKPFKLDAETILVDALSGYHKDILNTIQDKNELIKFIKAWNTKQTKVGSYLVDICTIVLLK